MTLIKQCQYDNMDLDNWDVVIFDDEKWPQLWVIKTSYHDGNTDCSWHYIRISINKEVDVCWSTILYKMEGEDAELLKAFILKWEILEDKNIERAKLLSDLEYYKWEIA